MANSRSTRPLADDEDELPEDRALRRAAELSEKKVAPGARGCRRWLDEPVKKLAGRVPTSVFALGKRESDKPQ